MRLIRNIASKLGAIVAILAMPMPVFADSGTVPAHLTIPYTIDQVISENPTNPGSNIPIIGGIGSSVTTGDGNMPWIWAIVILIICIVVLCIYLRRGKK